MTRVRSAACKLSANPRIPAHPKAEGAKCALCFYTEIETRSAVSAAAIAAAAIAATAAAVAAAITATAATITATAITATAIAPSVARPIASSLSELKTTQVAYVLGKRPVRFCLRGLCVWRNNYFTILVHQLLPVITAQ